MRHAGADALDQLEDTLVALRLVAGMKETSRGVFYRRGRAFLHFHEDPTGLYADVRLDGTTFERVRTTTKAERARLLAGVRRAVAGGA